MPPTILSDAAVRQYHEDGYYLARGFFDAEEIGLLLRSAKEDHELDRRSFQLLGKLRRHGAPYRVSAGKLAAELRLSSGAMTNRLDRMEKAGLIRRLADPNDRRGTLIEPTDEGHKAWDETVGEAARREASFTSVLSDAEKDKLHDLLRGFMQAFPNWEKKKSAQHEAEADGEAHAADPHG